MPLFPQRLRQLRKQKKLTAKAFGDMFNLAESTISGYETGSRKPDIELIEKFADFFGVSVDYLLGRTDNPSNGTDTRTPIENQPEVQFIMRARQELSPRAFEKFMELAKKTKEMFEDEDDA